jgi:hypothetical protein
MFFVDNGAGLWIKAFWRKSSPTSADHWSQHPKYLSGQIGMLAARLKRAISGVGASRFWTLHKYRGICATKTSGFT